MDPGENAEGDGGSPCQEILSEHVDADLPMTPKYPETPSPCVSDDANPEGKETEVYVPSSSVGDMPILGSQVYVPSSSIGDMPILGVGTFSKDDDMYAPNSNDTDSAGVGLENRGSTCYMNSVLQCLIHTVPLFRSIIASDKGDSWKCTCVANPEGFCLVCTLRKLFQLSTRGRRYFSKSFREHKQDDAHEYLTAIRTRLMEWHMEPSDSEENFIRKLFCVRTVNRLTCKKCEHSSSPVEDIFDIGLPIDESNSLSMALQSYMKEVEVEYTCETCGVAAGATQKIKMNLIPLVVTFLLKRFDDEGKKVEKYVSFPLELDLSDYTTTQSGQHKYVLYAIIVHEGIQAMSGHYLSFIRLSADKWCKFNDKEVLKAREVDALSQKAYILFYVKSGTDWFSDAIVPYADKQTTEYLEEAADVEVSVPSSSKGDGSLKEKSSKESSKENWMDSVIDILAAMHTPNSNDTDPAGVGLANLGRTCYVNSVLQCLIHTVPLFRSIIVSADKGDPWKCTRIATPEQLCLVCNLRQLFQMSTMGNGFVSPIKLVKNLSYFNERFRKDKEDDAHEFLTAIRTRLMEWHTKPKSGRNLIRRLFWIRTIITLTCKGCERIMTCAEDLFDIGLPIDESDSLSMALQSYMEKEEAAGYTCDTCGVVVGVTRVIRIKRFPLVVAFLLKRFDNKGNKVEKDVSFPMELDLTEYAERHSGEHRYVLYAIIVHEGVKGRNNSHYLTFARLSDKEWVKCNDELVSRVTEKEVLSQKAYILFYTKEGTAWFSDAIVPFEKKNHRMFLPF